MFALGAIVSLCYVPGLTGAFIATQWPVLSILLPLVMLFRGTPMTPFHWLGALFIAYATVRLWHSPIFADGVQGLWMVYIMGLGFWFGSTLTDLRGLYQGLAFGVSVSAAVAVSQQLGFTWVPYVSDAPAGLYVNAVAQGVACALVIVALVTERLWLWVPLPALGLALSGSRGAWVALAFGLAAAYFRRLWVFAGAAAAAAAFLVLPLSKSDAVRASIWSATIDNLTWLGYGPGAFFSWLLVRDGATFYPEYAHNDALQLAFEYGVWAALPLGILAYGLTRTTEPGWPVLVAFAIAGCYSMPLWVGVASFIGCVVAGRVVAGGYLARGVRHYSRQHVLPGRRETDYPGFAVVPVVAHNQAKG